MPKTPSSPVDAALDRVRTICFGFPGTEEKASHGMPSFHVRGKMFVHFVDNHHDDGRLAVWCKATHDEQRRRVEADPDRFFVPPYMGVKGWVGVRLDPPNMDWIDLAILVEEGWSSIVPKSVAREPARPPPKPVVYPKTDPKVAREAFERLSAICEALPGSTCEREGKHATYRIGKKPYAYFLDNHHGDGFVSACFKMNKGENAKLAKAEPKRFYLPSYIGPHGWVGMRLDAGRVSWRDVAARAEASYRAAAPKRVAGAAGAKRSRSAS